MLTLQHPIVRAADRDPRVLSRFWESVERREPAHACWEWRGRRGGGDLPIFTVKYHSVSAARFAWFTATGDFPVGGKLRHTCENRDCVRPEHLLWEVGRRTERMLRAKSDGYVPVAAAGRVAGPEADASLRRAS
jgi:hypothetical protein